MKSDQRLKVKVYSQFKVHYEDDADSVSSASGAGPFDVLAGHANFFTLLLEGDITIINDKKTHTFAVSRGIMQVNNDYVKVFVDI